MTFSKLTPSQETIAKAWLHDVFATAGMITPKRPLPAKDYCFMYGYVVNARASGRNLIQANLLANACKQIGNSILFRTVDYKIFEEMDRSLETLSVCAFIPDLTIVINQAAVTKKASILAKYVAYFCVSQHAYWDNSATSTYEMDEIVKTVIGKTLMDFGCFTSQRVTQVAAKKATVTANKAQPAATASNSGNQAVSTGPVNGYKGTGPHSGDIPNLLSITGQKEHPAVTLMYCVQADKVGKNTPNAFITPLIATASGVSKLSKHTAETVKFGSGNGYTDCMCWFADVTLAQDFMFNCRSRFGSKFNNIDIAKAKVDPNGYYEVSTEFGNCFIKAKKLNEVLEQNELQEDAEKDTVITYPSKQKLKIVRGYKIDDFDTFEEAFSKE